MEVKQLPNRADYIALDGSEIRLLPNTKKGGCAHCSLPAGKTSKAISTKLLRKFGISVQVMEKWQQWENEAFRNYR